MKYKLHPRNVKICKGCPPKELNLDTTPQFQFIFNKSNDTKKITIIDRAKHKIDNKLKSLF